MQCIYNKFSLFFPSCFKKSTKKKDKKKRDRNLQTTHVPGENVGTEPEPEQIFPPDDEAENIDLNDEDFETVKSDSTDVPPAEPVLTTSSDTVPSDEGKRAKRKRLRKERREARKLKRKQRSSKRRKKDKKVKTDELTNGKPRRRPCFIRFCKFLFCSSCCST